MRPETAEDLVNAIQSGVTLVEGSVSREYADVAFHLDWGPKGGHLKGVIGYAGTTINFWSTDVTKHELFFAGGGAMPHIATLKPDLVKGKTGTAYTISGEMDTLTLQIEMDDSGEKLFSPPIIIAGVGLGRQFECDVEFS